MDDRNHKSRIKKKIIQMRILCLLAAVVFLLPCSQVQAFGEAYTSNRELVKVGFFPFEGYHVQDENGIRSGYGYDILQEMLPYENWQYAYVGYDEKISWDKAQEMLENGEIDLLTSATMTDERLEKFAYSDLPIGYSSTILTVEAGNNQFDTKDYSTWNGMRVGMLANNTRNNSFDQYAQEHQFEYEKKEYDTPNELIRELKAGNLDLIVTSNLLRLDGVKIIDKFDEKPFYIIVKKENTQLLQQVNDGLEKVKENNALYIEDLYKTYYDPQSDGVVSFTKAEQSFISQCNDQGIVFKALLNPDRKPLSYAKDEELQGLLATICAEIFNRTGLQIEFVDIDSRAQYVSELKEGNANIVCDFTGTRSTAENYGYIRTNAYYNSSTSMLAKKNYDESGTKCALTKNSITNSALANRDGIEYIYYETMEECKDAVLDGTVDFTYGYTRTVQEMVYADVTNSLACITVAYMPIDFYMGINFNDNALLASIISKSVDSISEKDISYLSEAYTYYERRPSSFTSLIYEQPIVLLAMVVVLFITLMGSILLVLSTKRHKEETAANEKLSEALENAERANQAKTVFLSRVSHDMRTPLNGILGLTDILKEKTKDSQMKQDLSEMELSGKYLLDLINDTLDISRIESGKLELHPSVCGGKMLLDNTIRLANINAQKKGIQLLVNTEALTYCTLYADIGRVQQVLMNVISNAIKFTPQGGKVEITIRNIARDQEKLVDEYIVQDNGVGISKEFLPHVFENFSQEDVSRTSIYQGTGLGMAITKQILDAMGGSIKVESELGKGTRFIFTIPLQIATQEQIAQSRKGAEKLEENVILKGKRVLLCEDHPLNAKIARRLLEKKEMLVDHAENGKLGIELFQASSLYYYDLILMDVRMPVMDGIEATKAIRSLPREDAGDIPILAMTANTFADDVAQTKAAGMNGHIAKPVESEHMYALIIQALEIRKKRDHTL